MQESDTSRIKANVTYLLSLLCVKAISEYLGLSQDIMQEAAEGNSKLGTFHLTRLAILLGIRPSDFTKDAYTFRAIIADSHVQGLCGLSSEEMLRTEEANIAKKMRV
jgi:hypothetical protein